VGTSCSSGNNCCSGNCQKNTNDDDKLECGTSLKSVGTVFNNCCFQLNVSLELVTQQSVHQILSVAVASAIALLLQMRVVCFINASVQWERVQVVIGIKFRERE
jgi:hypothetical protein